MKLILLCLLLAGCATSLPADNRSPEQIAASVKDKSATVDCVTVTSIYGTIKNVRVSVDKSSLGTGGASISADPDTCKASIQVNANAVKTTGASTADVVVPINVVPTLKVTP